MTVLATLILAVGLAPRETILADRCDVVEINSFFDGEGRLAFEQVIAWRWHGWLGRHHVDAWRILKGGQRPARDPDGRWGLAWMDGRVLRRIRALSYRRTWTQFDPEVEDRCRFRKELRAGLNEP